MKEFFHYFFGKGEEVEFKNFTLAHFIPILLLIAVILLIYFYRDKIRGSKYEGHFRLALGFALIINEMAYFWRMVGVPSLGANPYDHLPISVCGWSIIFSSFMVTTKSQKLFDIVYFWLFSGTVFALINPTVISYTGPTRFRYYQFWLEHTLGYIAVFYMIFVHGFRPTWKSAIRSYIWLIALAVVAYIANTTLGGTANYLFMAKPEETKSILDILPKNFIARVALMGSTVTLLFFIDYLPWMIMDIRKKKKAKLVTDQNA